MNKITISAPAKINLFLDVLARRPDGFHNIRSIIAPVGVFDRITLETTSDKRIRVATSARPHFPGLPWPIPMATGSANLAALAARTLQAATGARAGANIRLEKHIPVMSGLGGGSSDAAAVLLGLNTLWKTSLSLDNLLELGAKLGSDVPALLLGCPALMQGRGEKVSPLPLDMQRKSLHFLLVNPGLPVSTADIYARFSKRHTFGSTTSGINEMVHSLCSGAVSETAAGLYNALEETVFKKFPLLAMIKGKILEAGAEGALLSGSGATLLALARSRAHAMRLAERMRSALDCPLWTAPAVLLKEAWPRRVACGGAARWCNGSTRPFGGQSLGSNPSRAIAQNELAGIGM